MTRTVICHYCKRDISHVPRYVITRAILPPRMKNRKRIVGYCCEACEAKGCATEIDAWKKEPSHGD